VDRRKIMHWPGHGVDGISAQSIANRTAPPLVIHWAGIKKARIGTMTGGDILGFFEQLYYSRLPAARVRRIWAGVRYPAAEWRHNLSVRFRQRWRMIMARPAKATARCCT